MNPVLLRNVLVAMAEHRFGLCAAEMIEEHPGDVTPTTKGTSVRYTLVATLITSVLTNVEADSLDEAKEIAKSRAVSLNGLPQELSEGTEDTCWVITDDLSGAVSGILQAEDE